MIVQNWIALNEDWILSWELGHQVTILGMPDNSGPDILLGPEAGVYIIRTEPQGGVAAALLAWHAAAQDSCLRVWIICVGDLSLYMEAVVIARHPWHKEKEMQMTPLFVPDTETMTSTIVELGTLGHVRGALCDAFGFWLGPWDLEHGASKLASGTC